MTKLRIFLADDHTVVREGLKALIATQPDMEVVGEAGDGRAALQGAKDRGPDVLVMDVSMPELGGAQATEWLKQAFPEVKVLALTVHEDRGYLRQLMEAGASGYVLKRAVAEELIQAIRVVAKGGTYLDPFLAGQVVGDYLRRHSPKGTPAGGVLSEREAEVLRLIAKGQTNREIAARFDVSVKTIETHKARAMEKLGLNSRAGIVSYAMKQGWLSDEGTPRHDRESS